MTGSGKTTLAQVFLSSRRYVIVLDTKRELVWKGFKVTESQEVAFNEEHSIFRPKSMKDVQAVFTRAYREGGWTICVDEVYMIGNGSIQSFPPGYVRCLTAGRSKGVTIYTLTQRPKYLPYFAMTESTHFFVFELGSNADRKDLSKLAGVDALDTQVTGHSFVYYNRRKRTTVKSKLALS